MGYECRVERASINDRGEKLVTFVVKYPRVCLAEVVTHRLVYETWGEEVYAHERTAPRDQSKSSASSRANPFERMVKTIREDPYMPMWTGLRRGMQGTHILDAVKLATADKIWSNALEFMVDAAKSLHDNEIHKQDCNRLLEPWAWVEQVCTSSRWDNFFALRCHEKAFPPFRKIARMMYCALKNTILRPLAAGDWHLPFVDIAEEKAFNWVPDIGLILNAIDYPISLPDLLKKSAARCAWVSYANHDKDATAEAHYRTYNSLFAEVPVHGGPVEHQGTPMHPGWLANWPRLRSNLTGFLQARKLIPHEEVRSYVPSAQEIASWDDVPIELK